MFTPSVPTSFSNREPKYAPRHFQAPRHLQHNRQYQPNTLQSPYPYQPNSMGGLLPTSSVKPSFQQHMQSPFSSPRPSCQICGKLNHSTLGCFHRMENSYQGRHPPAQLSDMTAHSPSSQDYQTRFADSEANQHITANLEHHLARAVHRV